MINSNKATDMHHVVRNLSRWLAGLASAALGLGISACAAPTSAVETAPQTQTKEQSKGLLIQGYNYTNHYIDSFSVNGAGGGNIFVSGPTTGGGGSVCCYSFNPAGPAKVTVKWSASYCMYSTTNKFGGTHFWRKSLFREVQVPVERMPTGEPEALEVHFFPDGHVEAAVTPGYSPPRLKLPITADEQRPGVSNDFPPCSHDQLQQGH